MTTSPIQLWLAIGAISVGTFVLRYSFVGWIRGRETPTWLSKMLRFIPPALLAALVVSAVLNQSRKETWPAPIIAAGIAFFVAWRTKNMLLLISVGMTALWVLRAWFF